MKKKVRIGLILLLLLLGIGFGTYRVIQDNERDKANSELIQNVFTSNENNDNNEEAENSNTQDAEETSSVSLDEIKSNYGNDNIVGIISIPGTEIMEVVVKGNDNSYYLNHDAYNKKNVIGATFLDYRVNINDRKILIYSHNSSTYDVPFKELENYYDEEFFKNNQIIKIYNGEKIVNYQIFSVYVETSDWSYMNLDFTDEEWYLHLQYLKNKSFYDTGVNVREDDEIIIVQTCSYAKEYKKYDNKYLLVIGKKIKD